jgi:hypothetical protein
MRIHNRTRAAQRQNHGARPGIAPVGYAAGEDCSREMRALAGGCES